jgi:wyosine [tRNA(Phe)-imidazoG37] synthetase (radical SAM superfamily)
VVQVTYYSPWKAAHHPDRLARIKAGLPVAPTNIQIDLEGWCPHSCVFCACRNAGWQGEGMHFDPPKRVGEGTGLAPGIAMALPVQMAELGIGAVEITGGGEPLAYPNLLSFVDACRDNGISRALITNGAFFGPRQAAAFADAAWVRLSLDAATSQAHSAVHRAPESSFGHIVKNLEHFLSVKNSSCIVGASFVIAPENVGEILAAAILYRELGLANVRYTVIYESTRTGWLSPDELVKANALLAEAQKLQTDAFRVFGAIYRLDYYSRPNIDFSACHAQRFVWAIGTDGMVYPCCIEKYHRGFEIGDLRHETLRQIAERQAETVKTFDVTKCKPCWLRDKNQFVSYLLEENPAHVDYV